MNGILLVNNWEIALCGSIIEVLKTPEKIIYTREKKENNPQFKYMSSMNSVTD